jgi:hypothetical protein
MHEFAAFGGVLCFFYVYYFFWADLAQIRRKP